MEKNEKNQTHLIIKSFGYYVKGGNPIAKKGYILIVIYIQIKSISN